MDFPAKILLFGEYGILLNSKALSMPYPRFSGRLRMLDHQATNLNTEEAGSNASLKSLLRYMILNSNKFSFIRLDQFQEEVKQGLYFDSSIPSGSGLGSSGALTAALYNRYAIDTLLNDYQKIQSYLAEIESCFHGISSGIDPLTSLLNRTLLIENKYATSTTPDLSAFFNTYSLFLINSNSIGNTSDLVTYFMKKYLEPEFRGKIDEGYIPVINQTIDSLTANDFNSFTALISRYSQFQLSHFERMVPDTMRKYFLYGIETGNFYLKLCGSGGGGYLLAISADRTKAENYFKLNHLDYTIV
jgi:mevalonate kinase